MAGLEEITNHELRRDVRNTVHAERKSTIRVLDRLNEFERRRLHLQIGFRSMFAYCTKELKYSESAANRRIAGARTLRRFPEVRAMIANGDLSLTNLSRMTKYLRREDAISLLRQACNKTRPEMDEIIAWLEPAKKPRESVKSIVVDVPVAAAAPPVLTEQASYAPNPGGPGGGLELAGDQKFTAAGEDIDGERGPGGNGASGKVDGDPAAPTTVRIRRYGLSFSVSESTMKNIERAKRLVPGGSDLDSVVSKVFEEFVDRHDPERYPRRGLA